MLTASFLSLITHHSSLLLVCAAVAVAFINPAPDAAQPPLSPVTRSLEAAREGEDFAHAVAVRVQLLDVKLRPESALAEVVNQRRVHHLPRVDARVLCQPRAEAAPLRRGDEEECVSDLRPDLDHVAAYQLFA